MPSLIDPTTPVDGVPAVKADLRANLQSAKDEIEALQSVRWAGGISPVVTPAANAIDICAFVTRDGGATWFGFLGGKDFS